MPPFAGCGESYFDINQNPNRAVESNMTPNLILPSALNRVGVLTAATQPSTDFTNLNGACGDYQQWMGYYARCAGTYGPNTDVEAFQLSASFHQGVWHDWMDVLKDLDVMEKSAVAREVDGLRGHRQDCESHRFYDVGRSVQQYLLIPNVLI